MGGRRGKDDRKRNTLAPLYVCLAFLSYSIRARTKVFVRMKVIGLLFRFFNGFLKRCLSCERLFTQFFSVSNKEYACLVSRPKLILYCKALKLLTYVLN